jgi:hypothetical protein
MVEDERIWQALQRTQSLYQDHDNIFNVVDCYIDRTLTNGDLALFEEPDNGIISEKDIVFSYLEKLRSISPEVHSSLRNNLDELALPIGRTCTLRLIDDTDRPGLIRYVDIPRTIVMDSGLAPSVRIHKRYGAKIRPHLEITGRYIDPATLFGFASASPILDERGRRYSIPWVDVRAIALNRH